MNTQETSDSQALMISLMTMNFIVLSLQADNSVFFYLVQWSKKVTHYSLFNRRVTILQSAIIFFKYFSAIRAKIIDVITYNICTWKTIYIMV